MKKHLKRLAASAAWTKVVLPVLLVLALVFIGYSTFKKPSSESTKNSFSAEEIKTKTEAFINAYLMAPGSTASITEVSEEAGLFKVKVDIGSDIVESYVDKGFTVFFPQGFNINDYSNNNAPTNGGDAAAPAAEAPKSDKPVVELFVMSHCPYGTQIEKGILPVVKALGDKIDFELKFVDYAMHGETELKEQLNQYCIQEEQNNKFMSYMDCFLVAGDTEGCLNSTGIDRNKLNSCVQKTDAQFKITENFKNNVGFQGTFPGFDIHKTDNQKYGVAGSPTLIINGAEIAASRDAASLMTTICSAFNNAPAECNTQMPSETPAPGFGTETTSATTAAACN